MPTRPKPVDATLHGVVDYVAGLNLLTLGPKAMGVGGTRSARQVRAAGAFHLAYSGITDYPLGAIKLLPFRAHLAIDAVAAVALAATPLATGQWRQGRKHWLPHLALGAFELSALALTDPTGRGDYHGDVASVRAANLEDPHEKIYTGPRAVAAAAAA